HRDHLRLGLALLHQLADAIAGGLHHLVVGGDVRLLPQWAVADDHLGLVVDKFEPHVGGANHAPDVAAVGEVGLLVAMIVVHDVAGRQHVRVLEINVGVAVGVRVVGVRQDRLASADLEGDRAADIGLLGQRARRGGRGLVAGGAVGGAGGKAYADV